MPRILFGLGLLTIFQLFSVAPLTAEGSCQPSATQLCLQNSQFGVTVDWTSTTDAGSGQVLGPISDDNGFFRFEDAQTAEVMVKVLNGCALNNRYWVFMAQVSTHAQDVAVTNFASGETKSYPTPLGTLPTPVTDTEAFPCSAQTPQPQRASRSLGSNLLLANRFQVSVEWNDFENNQGIGTGVPITSRSGSFWFFSATNPVLLVKAFPNTDTGSFGIAFSGTTNVAYDLTVLDTCNGQTKTYTNPLGNAGANNDSDAFPIDCPAEIFSDGFESGNLSAWAPQLTSAYLDISEAVDSRIDGRDAATAKPIFTLQDHTAEPPAYVRNPDSWISDLNLTALSPWNDNLGHRQAGTLISPRHIIFAAHYPLPIGATIRFVDLDNNVIERTMIDRRIHPDYEALFPDIAIGLLDADVPPTITYAKVLPDDWRQYISSEAGLPALCLDQEEKALIADLSTEGLQTSFVYPTEATRLQYSEALIGGDSGNPAFLIVNHQLVLLTVWTFGGPGSGTSVFEFKDDINAMMADLGTSYELTEFDMSIYSLAPPDSPKASAAPEIDPANRPFLGDLQ